MDDRHLNELWGVAQELLQLLDENAHWTVEAALELTLHEMSDILIGTLEGVS